MNKFLIALCALLLSHSLMAHTVFVGTLKGTNHPCSLEVEQFYYENNVESPENFRADVAINLKDGHNHFNHSELLTFSIKPSGKPQVLSGVGANQKDLINVLTASGSMGLDSPVSFAVKWLHGNHYHTDQCLNLVKADHE